MLCDVTDESCQPTAEDAHESLSYNQLWRYKLSLNEHSR